jgi:hypothetical protein
LRRGLGARVLLAALAALAPAPGAVEAGADAPRAATPLGAPVWSTLIGTSRDDNVVDVAVNSAGLIAVAGITDGPIDGFPNRLTDAWVAVYDASGQRRWLRRFGTPQDEITTSVAITDSGEVWVAGDTYGGMQGNVNAGLRDGFLTRFTADGSEVWNVHISTDEIERARGLAVRSDGAALVVGTVYGNFPGFSNEGKSREAWVTLIGPDGRRVWLQQFGSPLSDTTTDATVDAAGTFTVAGYTDAALGVASRGGRDGWVARLAADGTRAWTTQIGGTAWPRSGCPPRRKVSAVARGGSGEAAYGVAVAGDGAVIVTGVTDGEIERGSGYCNDDAWVARVSGTGRLEWVRQIGSSGADGASTSAVSKTGLIYTALGAGGALPGATSLGGVDAAVVVRYADGSLRLVSQFGGAGNEGASGVAAMPDGRIVVTGTTEAGMFGVAGLGLTDGWLAVYDPVPAKMTLTCRRGASTLTRTGATSRPTCPRGWVEKAARARG